MKRKPFNRRMNQAKYSYARRRCPTVLQHTIDETGVRYELEMAFAAGAIWAQRTINRVGGGK